MKKYELKNNDMMEYISQNLWLLDCHYVHFLPHPGVASGDFYVDSSSPSVRSSADPWARSVLVTGSGLGGMFRTQYPVDPSASGKAIHRGADLRESNSMPSPETGQVSAKLLLPVGMEE